jgi:hypothetical protein
MKKTAIPRNKRIELKNRNNPDVNIEAMKILRTVGDNEAFYFYEAVGRPTGQAARNLSDFLENVKSAKSESLAFHLQRNDFQHWIERTIGDSKLAKKLRLDSSSSCEETRQSICRAVENRIRELKGNSVAFIVGQDSAVVRCQFSQ